MSSSDGETCMSDELTVVIVDDSRSALNQMSGILDEIEGVQVVGTATDGLTGMTIATQRKPDLMLMDIVMPHLDGIAALRMVRARLPSARVAMVSSVGASQSRAEEAFRLGAVQVLAKPIDPEQIAALCESELERKRCEVDASGGSG